MCSPYITCSRRMTPLSQQTPVHPILSHVPRLPCTFSHIMLTPSQGIRLKGEGWERRAGREDHQRDGCRDQGGIAIERWLWHARTRTDCCSLSCLKRRLVARRSLICSVHKFPAPEPLDVFFELRVMLPHSRQGSSCSVDDGQHQQHLHHSDSRVSTHPSPASLFVFSGNSIRCRRRQSCSSL